MSAPMFASLTAVARKIEPDLLLQERDHSQSVSIAYLSCKVEGEPGKTREAGRSASHAAHVTEVVLRLHA